MSATAVMAEANAVMREGWKVLVEQLGLLYFKRMRCGHLSCPRPRDAGLAGIQVDSR